MHLLARLCLVMVDSETDFIPLCGRCVGQTLPMYGTLLTSDADMSSVVSQHSISKAIPLGFFCHHELTLSLHAHMPELTQKTMMMQICGFGLKICSSATNAGASIWTRLTASKLMFFVAERPCVPETISTSPNGSAFL
jgi:hypothetical protein